jgi:hypothetical protein
MKAILFLLCTVSAISGQYELKRSVIANGGGDVSGGSYSGTTTIGQPAVGGSTTFDASAHFAGFWLPEFFPTAAGVSIAGRVFAPGGAGLANATIYLTGRKGETLVTRTSSFGHYHFDDVVAGQTVVISVSSRRYVYAPRTLSLHENVNDVDFLPIE